MRVFALYVLRVQLRCVHMRCVPCVLVACCCELFALPACHLRCMRACLRVVVLCVEACVGVLAVVALSCVSWWLCVDVLSERQKQRDLTSTKHVWPSKRSTEDTMCASS